MRTQLARFQQIALRVVASEAFFWGVTAVFIVQALWLALSADFPMPFDEEFHVGVIKIYAQQWSPFLVSQPPGSEVFGSLISDPSYLFHYILSFPYRLLSGITDNQAAQVIMLRLINIGLFAAGLVVFRLALLRVLSRRLTHLALVSMTLIPVVPFLAAQVNYDNAIFLIVAVLTLLTLRILQAVRDQRVPVRDGAIFIITTLLGSLVKYTLLPIVAGMVLCVAVYAVICWRGQWHKCGAATLTEWRGLAGRARAVLCLFLVLAGGLFIQKYGTNVVRYGTPIPKCHQVMQVDQCMAFGPWGRNHQLAQVKGYVDPNPFAYGVMWVRGLTQRLFFTLGGKDTNYATRAPLPLPMIVSGIVLGAGLLCLALRPQVLRDPALALFAVTIGLYAAALFLLDNYPQYLQTGQPVAINGRYLIPLIPLALALFGRAFQVVWGAGRQRSKVLLAGLVLCCLLQGGGVLTFIVRSEPSWYWQNNVVLTTNKTAQKIIKPVIIEGGSGK